MKEGTKKDFKPFSVSVVIPALNEEHSLEKAVNEVLKVGRKYEFDMEIIIVNDCSTDRTLQIADRLSIEMDWVHVIHNPFNMGIGGSFLNGAKMATKESVVMIPGDAENDPEQILRYAKVMDMVDIIVPFVSNMEVRSKARRVVSSFFRFIVNMSFGTSLNYTNGTVLYKRYVLNDISCKTRGFFYQTELLIRAIRQGYLYCEMPVALDTRHGGISRALTLKNLADVCRAYLCLIFDIHIRRQEGPLGSPNRRPPKDKTNSAGKRIL